MTARVGRGLPGPRPPPSHHSLPMPGTPGRRREPRVISAGRVGDPWSHLQLRYRLPSRREGGAPGIAPRPLPFLERLCGAPLRCASGQGESSRVCVARAAPVTPSSSSRNRRPLPALAGRAFCEGAPEAKLGVRPRKPDSGEPRSPEGLPGTASRPCRPLGSGRVINQTVRRGGAGGGGACCWPLPARVRGLPWRDSQRPASRAGEAGGAWGRSPGLGCRTPARLRGSPAGARRLPGRRRVGAERCGFGARAFSFSARQRGARRSAALAFDFTPGKCFTSSSRLKAGVPPPRYSVPSLGAARR